MKRVFKFCKKALLVLVFAALVGFASVSLFSGKVSAKSVNFRYVSLGDSMSTAFGYDDYYVDKKEYSYAYDESGNGNLRGLTVKAKEAYTAKVFAYLEEQLGTGSWEQLAANSLRIDDIYAFLAEEGKYEADDTFNRVFAEDGDGEEWITVWKQAVKAGASDDGLAKLRKVYQKAVSGADVITLDAGYNNFGTYIVGRLSKLCGAGEGTLLPSYGMNDNDTLQDVIDAMGVELNVDDIYDMIYAYVQQYAGIDLEEFEVISFGGFEIQVKAFVELVVQAYVSYCYYLFRTTERIYELNPDVTLIVVGLDNTQDDLSFTFNDKEYNVGEVYGYLINLANLFAKGLNPVSDKYYFVDVEGLDVELIFDDLKNDTLDADMYNRLIEALCLDSDKGGLFDIDATFNTLVDQMGSFTSLFTMAGINLPDMKDDAKGTGVSKIKAAFAKYDTEDERQADINAAVAKFVKTLMTLTPDQYTTLGAAAALQFVYDIGYVNGTHSIGKAEPYSGLSSDEFTIALFSLILPIFTAAANVETINVNDLVALTANPAMLASAATGIFSDTPNPVLLSALNIYAKVALCNGMFKHPSDDGHTTIANAIIEVLEGIKAESALTSRELWIAQLTAEINEKGPVHYEKYAPIISAAALAYAKGINEKYGIDEHIHAELAEIKYEIEEIVIPSLKRQYEFTLLTLQHQYESLQRQSKIVHDGAKHMYQVAMDNLTAQYNYCIEQLTVQYNTIIALINNEIAYINEATTQISYAAVDVFNKYYQLIGIEKELAKVDFTQISELDYLDVQILVVSEDEKPAYLTLADALSLKNIISGNISEGVAVIANTVAEIQSNAVVFSRELKAEIDTTNVILKDAIDTTNVLLRDIHGAGVAIVTQTGEALVNTTNSKLWDLVLAGGMYYAIKTAPFNVNCTTNYLSLGDSSMTGMGLGADVNGPDWNYGYGQVVAEAYPQVFADMFNLTGDNHTTLGMGGIRVEDLLYILNLSYEGDDYFNKNTLGSIATHGTGTYGGTREAINATFVSEIAKADLISLGIGGNNYGTYVNNQLASFVMTGHYAYELDFEQFNTSKYFNAVMELVEYVKGLVAQSQNAKAQYFSAMFELYAYAYLCACANIGDVLDNIQAINPDANILLVGLFNPFSDLYYEDEYIYLPLGDIIEVLTQTVNLQYYVAAFSRSNIIYVDISDTSTFMDEDENAPSMNYVDGEFMAYVTADRGVMAHPSEAGHKYIAEQLAKHVWSAGEHNWGTPEYEWNELHTECTATVKCLDNPAHTETETVSSTKEVTTHVGCSNDELSTVTAVFTNPLFETQVKEDAKTADAIEHSYVINYYLSEDNTKITAKKECENDSEYCDCHVAKSETQDCKYTITQEASCENEELRNIFGEFDDPEFPRVNIEDLKTADKWGHKWSEPTYTWSSDYSTCTASISCSNEGCKYVVNEEVSTSTPNKTQDADCNHVELTTFTATFSYKDSVTNEALFETQVAKDVETAPIDSDKHSWSVSYAWSKDYSTCLAVRACAICADHTYDEEGVITVTDVQQLSCIKDEVKTFTAKFSDPAFSTQTKANIVTVAHTGNEHKWMVTYSWKADKSECTANFTCLTDNSHKDSETVKSSANVTQEQACETPEITTYTAVFTKSGAETQETSAQTKAGYPHSLKKITYVWSEDNSEVTGHADCTNEGCSYGITETVPSKKTVTQQATCELEEISMFTATFTNELFTYLELKNIKTGDPLSHDYSIITYNYEGTTCTATKVCSHDATHFVTEVSNGIPTVIQQLSCEQDEITRYTFVFTDAAFAQQVVEVKTADKKNHNWKAATYAWDGFDTCTATSVCANDANHVVTETVKVVATVTAEQSCLSDELTKYTATFENSLFAQQVKANVKTADKLEHILNAGVVVTEATASTKGTIKYTCTVCQTEINKEFSYASKSVVDQASGVVVDANTNVIPEGTEIIVEQTNDKSLADISEKAQANIKVLGADAQILSAYNISMIRNNQTVQPNGSITITLPAVSAELAKGDKLTIVFVASDGSIEQFETTVNADGTITFTTNHLSVYAVVKTSTAVPFYQQAWFYNVLIGAACAAVVVVVIFVRKKESK